MNKIKPKALVPAPVRVAGPVKPEPIKVQPVIKPPLFTFSKKRTILILEDDDDRVRAFEKAVGALGSQFKLFLWRDAPTMKSKCADLFTDACLISLDHDLAPLNSRSPDPGTGLEVAEFLCRHKPVCPVILHTSNHERRWSMHNEFRFAGWNVEIVPPIGGDWIQHSWLSAARTLIGLQI